MTTLTPRDMKSSIEDGVLVLHMPKATGAIARLNEGADEAHGPYCRIQLVGSSSWIDIDRATKAGIEAGRGLTLRYPLSDVLAARVVRKDGLQFQIAIRGGIVLSVEHATYSLTNNALEEMRERAASD